MSKRTGLFVGLVGSCALGLIILWGSVMTFTLPQRATGRVTVDLVRSFTAPNCCTGVLMFSSQGQIRLADLDRGVLTRVADAGYAAEHQWRFSTPRQRPDRPTQIAFIGRRADVASDAAMLFVLDLATRRFRRVPNTPPSNDVFLRHEILQWSPDGTRLLYNQDQWLFTDYDAEDFQVVVVDAPEQTWSVRLQPPFVPYVFLDAVWHPRTGQILGIYKSENAPVHTNLGTIETDCWLQQACWISVDDVISGSLTEGLLGWHVDGQRVLFTGHLLRGYTTRARDLLEADLQTNTVRQVNPRLGPNDRTLVVSAVYSPDGRMIAYSADPDGPLGIGDDPATAIRGPQEIIIVDAATYAEVARIPVSGAHQMTWLSPLPDGVLPTPAP